MKGVKQKPLSSRTAKWPIRRNKWEIIRGRLSIIGQRKQLPTDLSLPVDTRAWISKEIVKGREKVIESYSLEHQDQ